MAEITGGEALARCLAQEGIRTVFGLPCPEIDPFLAALEGNGIRLVPVRHEAAGAHMAEGLYKTTGEVAAVLGNPGPGSANLVAGVLTARHEGVPLVGNTSTWAALALPPTRPRSYLSILELGMLGTGIPSALGAKLGSPDRDVVCVTGDGAAGFHFMEMQSAAREGLAFTTVVCAEGSWTMEEPNERLRYGRTFGTEMGEVRWDKVAEGLGCAGFFVEKGEELAPALEQARDCDGPAVVCVRTNREANLALPADAFKRFFEVYQGPGE
jgi:thiamine pyrophosphate-dependent acetolactate synthase large subunit-like protein